MVKVNASVARQTLTAQLDRVERGEEVEITRHNKVVAVLVRPDVLRARRADDALHRADDIGARLDAARSTPLRTAKVTAERVDELVRAAADGRR